jgi:hypothetical protein
MEVSHLGSNPDATGSAPPAERSCPLSEANSEDFAGRVGFKSALGRLISAWKAICGTGSKRAHAISWAVRIQSGNGPTLPITV